MSETGKITITKGDSSREYVIHLDTYPDIGSPNWIGTLTVREKNIRGRQLLSKTVEKDFYKHKFVVYLSPSETESLPIGTLHLSLEVKNLHDYQVAVRKEVWQKQLIILNSGVPNGS